MTRLPALEAFARRPPSAAPPPGEGGEASRCQLCAEPLEGSHRHLLQQPGRRVRCACAGCALLFDHSRSSGGRFRTIPRRVLIDRDWSPGVREWAESGLPVQLGAIVRETQPLRWLGLFPSPAGMMEGEIDEARWEPLAARGRLAEELVPDVEALLFRRERQGDSIECLLAPIDACFELAGQVRRCWRGLGGGDEVLAAIAELFERLRKRAAPIGAPAEALGKGAQP